MRRTTFAVGLGLWMACALACAPATQQAGDTAAGDDWPRFLGPDVDGRSPEIGLLLEWPESGPPLLWQREVGDGYSMASVAEGRLFVFDRHGDHARLSCLRSETGEEIWQTEYPTDYEDLYGFSNGPRAAPVVDGERVYTFGAEGRLRCHHVEDGRLLWEVDTAQEFGVVQNFFGAGSAPLIEDDLLIALIGGSPPGSPGVRSGEVQGNGSAIVAFDKETGKVRYQASDELASYSSPTIATMRGRRRGFVFARGGLLGFHPATGAVDFHFPWRSPRLETVNASNPVVVDDLVFLSESYGPGSVLLRIGDGEPEVIWKDPRRPKSMKTHWMTPVHHEGTLYGSSGSGSGDAELRAVDLATGKLLWKEPGLGRSTLLYVEGHLIVLTEFGTLLVVRATPSGYEPISELTLQGGEGEGEERRLLKHPAWTPPILAHGLLYARGKDRLVCLDLRPTQ
jgi:outer membrane protein assembly factor BamB